MYQQHTTVYPGGVAMLVESGGSVPPLDTDGRQSVLRCSAVSAVPGCTIIILLTTIITGSLNFTVSTF